VRDLRTWNSRLESYVAAFAAQQVRFGFFEAVHLPTIFSSDRTAEDLLNGSLGHVPKYVPLLVIQATSASWEWSFSPISCDSPVYRELSGFVFLSGHEKVIRGRWNP
jgi:hypothetical protein